MNIPRVGIYIKDPPSPRVCATVAATIVAFAAYGLANNRTVRKNYEKII